jgi:transposase
VRAWPAPNPALSAAGGQGVLDPQDPISPAATQDQGTIPEKSDQRKTRAAKGSRGGRPVAFNPEAYKDRNTVERTINKLKGFRAVAMRTDQREFVFRGTIDLASIKIWLRNPTKQDP